MFDFCIIDINHKIQNILFKYNYNVYKECEGGYLHHLFDLRLNSFKNPFLAGI